ncbi:RCS-specific HTH-type transcriptional activator RclR [BD1-7 clade bacterium]|uniref:RCS-specific HTH-type transcriptional activator RclR n=1 Tax=BD1-7 clade bacterium TaxID=2029982 RepID=A0A5S9QJ78_9GAMM|nr:RCS-specific HTH-type transcriptional activator RclR [BD1-7 clade bacterium]
METPIRDLPPMNDPLGQSLYLLRLNGSLYCYSELTAPWGIEMPILEGKMMFHIITRGHCWLQVGDQTPIALANGSLALVPRGRGHRLFSSTDSPVENLLDIPVETISERFEIMHYGGDATGDKTNPRKNKDERTELTCGVLGFDHIAGRHLVDQLPKAIVIAPSDHGCNTTLTSILNLIQCEATALKPGGETVLTHLADILVIYAIRHWLETADEAQQGWLAALRDKYIGTALAAIHRQPDKNWTVSLLAKEVGMSRSGFSARFSELVGNSPKSYLTRWRMQIARSQLQQQSVPLAVLAETLGYNSEAAFSRAFKREMGVSPGSLAR